VTLGSLLQKTNLQKQRNRPPQNILFRLQYSPFEYPDKSGLKPSSGLPSAPGSPTVNVREHIPRKGGFPYAQVRVGLYCSS
jgi:hypothetical protein